MSQTAQVQAKLAVFVASIALVIAVDQGLKWWVCSTLPAGSSWVVLPGVLKVTHGLTSGAFFGWLPHWAALWKLAGFASVALAATAVSVLLFRGFAPRERVRPIALGLVLGGTLGNFVDRVARGAVVDFIQLDLVAGFRWPDFNVADVAIFVGALVLLVELLTAEGREREGAPGEGLVSQ